MITFRNVVVTGMLLASNYVMFQAATRYAEEIAKARAVAGQAQETVTPIMQWGTGLVSDHPIFTAIGVAGLGLVGFLRWLGKDPSYVPKFDYQGTVSEVQVSALEGGNSLYSVAYTNNENKSVCYSAVGKAGIKPGTKVLLRVPMFATNIIVRECDKVA
jgi:hypothetical protein